MGTAEQCDRPLVSTSLTEDVFYIILDHLQGDVSALSKCSVICRAWLHPSRRHLFRALTVYHGFDALKNQRGLSAFVGFLRACGDARRSLQHLILCSELWRPQADVPDVDNTLPLVVDELFALLDAGINIQRLTLIDVSWTGNANWTAPLPRRVLKRLDIEEWIGSDQEVLDVLKLIGAFDRLELLSLSLFAERNYVEETTGLLDKYAEIGHFPSVCSFRYYTSPEWRGTPLYQLIKRSCCRDQDTLARISFRIWDYADSWERISEFCRFLCDTGVRSHVRELEFDPSNGPTFWSQSTALPADWGVFNLSRLDELAQLILALDCEDVSYVSQGLPKELNAYAFILRTNPPPALQSLAIKLRIPDTASEEPQKSRLEAIQRASHRPAWSAFDEALQALRTAPQVVIGCVNPRGDMIQCRNMDQWLEAVLPLTHARGRLRWAISLKDIEFTDSE
ncbi:hypothetical protein GY45DRAFT_1327839 [Cubamyces sp. BRFM 1775]|nr:hypothetical protein GY45DRAFT_1327839 [Cubamyces sp. BRFM 1775]